VVTVDVIVGLLVLRRTGKVANGPAANPGGQT
jgi:hypothetical protein